MEFLGIGPLELAAILIIALIVLGPKDMVKAGGTLGKTLRTIVASPIWKAMQSVQELPGKLIKQAGLEELDKEMQEVTNSIDSRFNSRSFSETFDEATLTPPEPAPPTYDTDLLDDEDPAAAASSPKNPQV